MKILGIDFGTKRIGLAISDDEGSFAFPLKTIEVSKTIFDEIDSLVKERGVEILVLGDPGSDEGVQGTREKVLDFKQKLEERGHKVELQSEMMTSLYTDQFFNKKPIANKRGGDQKEKKDESAAAMILQRYLDTKNKNHA
jgi:putative Holliday junction resolvase